MAKKAAIFLADGFEETEAIAPYDVLHRGGVSVDFISIKDGNDVTSSHSVSITAHKNIKDGIAGYDALILPGGMPGTINLGQCQPLKEAVAKAYANGLLVGAICAAPTVLGELGLLKGKRATCFPGMEDGLADAIPTGEQVVRDGNVITSIGAGAALDFGVALLAYLTTEENALKVKAQMQSK